MAAQSALGLRRRLQMWGGAAALEELMGGLAAEPRVGISPFMHGLIQLFFLASGIPS